MKKAIICTLTTIAIMTIFVIGAGQELTTGATITAVIALVWLGLVAVANTRRRHRDH